MSDDDETLVRQRLLRLTGQVADPALPPLIRPVEPAPIAPRRAARRVRGAAERESTPERVPPGAGASRTPDDLPPPPSRLGGLSAFDPGRRGIKALAVVTAVMVVGAGVFAWRARPQVEPVADASSDLTAAPPTPGAPSASGGELVVAVAGRVRRPGLVRLPAGARVADVLDAAGGALPGTDVALLNLARKVSDGELILVGVTAPPGAQNPAGPGGGGPGVAAPGPEGGAPGGGKVNLNTATLAQLDALPGVGPVLAQRILDHRQRHGTFRSVGDLREVDGIGDARFEQLRELVTV